MLSVVLQLKRTRHGQISGIGIEPQILTQCFLLEDNRNSRPITFQHELSGEESAHFRFFCFLNNRGLIVRLPSAIETTDDRLTERFASFCPNVTSAFRTLRTLKACKYRPESLQLDARMKSVLLSG